MSTLSGRQIWWAMYQRPRKVDVSSQRVEAAATHEWQQDYFRALRQNALRMLIATSPDLMTC